MTAPTPEPLPTYEWPPLPVLDREEAATILAERLQAAWDDLERTRIRIAMQYAARQVPPPERSWAQEFQIALAAFMGAVQADVEAWLRLHLAPTYELAVVEYLGGGPMEWSTAHVAALTALAVDTYADFLQRAEEAQQVGRAFATAVRRAASRELPGIAAGGRTARQGGDALASRLIDEYGIDHVTYRDGTHVQVRHYARMAARTKSAVAYNSGSLNAYYADGVGWVEVFDGRECGWRSHDDPDKAARTIRPIEEAAQYAIAHPNCGRGFGARPDVTSAEEAATAQPFGPEPVDDGPGDQLPPATRQRARDMARTLRAARRAERAGGSAPAASRQSIIDAVTASRGL